jgi:hypothetical protein
MKPRDDDSLSCSEARAVIQVRLDEPLNADSETALSRHVAVCKPCAVYQGNLVAVRSALRSIPLLELPAGVRENLPTAEGERDTP